MPSAASQLDHFFGEDGTSKGCDEALHFRSGMGRCGLGRIYPRHGAAQAKPRGKKEHRESGRNLARIDYSLTSMTSTRGSKQTTPEWGFAIQQKEFDRHSEVD